MIELVGQDNPGGVYAKLIRLARLPRLYRLFRIFRVCKGVKQIQCSRQCQKRLRVMKAHSGVTRMLTVMVYVLISVHIISCLWVMTSKVDNYNEDTWLYRKNAISATGADQYLFAIYWAFQTLTTVGFGDIPAITVFERILALFWMIFGVGFYSFTIGNLSSIISSLDAKSAEVRHKIDSFYEFSQRVKLPNELIDRVVRHLEHSKNKINVKLEQGDVISQLPSALKSEIVKQTHKEIILKIKILHEKNLDFIWMFLHMLQTLHLIDQQDLYLHGDYAQQVFFIFNGKIQLRTPDGIPFVRFLLGSMFGEVEMIFNSLRYCTATAQVKTDLLQIKKKNFNILLESYPKVKHELRRIAKLKVRRHEEAIQKIKIKGATLKNTLNQIQHSIEESEKQMVIMETADGISRKNTKSHLRRMNSKMTIESSRPIQEQKPVAGTTIKVFDDPTSKDGSPRNQQKLLAMEETFQESKNIRNLLKIIEDSELSEDSSSLTHDIYLTQNREKSNLKAAQTHHSLELKGSSEKYSSNDEIIRKVAEERLGQRMSLLGAPVKKSKDTGEKNSALDLILKEESKLILKEKEGQNLQPEQTTEARLAHITQIHAQDWTQIYSAQNNQEKQKSVGRLEELKSVPNHEEVLLLSCKVSSRPSMPQSMRRLDSPGKKEPEQLAEELKKQREEAEQYEGNDKRRALTLVSFNENMNLLALNAAHIFKIFDALGTESEYVSGEMMAMKGMMEELQQNQKRLLNKY